MNRRIPGAFARVSMLVHGLLAVVLVVLTPLPAASDVFDIPAQSLPKAIDAFCAATGAEVYYDGATALGLRSSAVSGDYARDGALQVMLDGTDLVPMRVRGGAYLLINPGDDAARALATAKDAQDARYQQYFSVVQQGVLHGLCSLPAKTSLPGRMVIRLWIDPAGAVRRLEMEDDSHADARMSELQASLRHLRLPKAPPQDMPQPVTIALLPGKTAAASYCPPSDLAAGR